MSGVRWSFPALSRRLAHTGNSQNSKITFRPGAAPGAMYSKSLVSQFGKLSRSSGGEASAGWSQLGPFPGSRERRWGIRGAAARLYSASLRHQTRLPSWLRSA